MIEIRIVDVAARARELFGDQADYIAGRPLPEHDYRFEVGSVDGRCMTFGNGDTAAHVAAYLAELGELPTAGGES